MLREKTSESHLLFNWNVLERWRLEHLTIIPCAQKALNLIKTLEWKGFKTLKSRLK
jgi:hypothetical protein